MKLASHKVEEALGFKSSAEANFSHLTRVHPCFSKEAHGRYGRMHLPVAPTCNLFCNFCKRRFSNAGYRPGLAAGLLKPRQTPFAVRRALRACPEITVVGVAGPGDPLATGHALAALNLVHKEFPHLIKCLATNGLLLEERIDEVHAAGVQAVTVTVNGSTPRTVARICPRLIYKGEALSGIEAGVRLLENQLTGIHAAAARGMTVKVNTVLVPGVNDQEIGAIASSCQEAGARMINVIPLIPQHRFADQRPPTCAEISRARREAERYLSVFRHCRLCRADAVGIPGAAVDHRQEVYGELAMNFSHG